MALSNADRSWQGYQEKHHALSGEQFDVDAEKSMAALAGHHISTHVMTDEELVQHSVQHHGSLESIIKTWDRSRIEDTHTFDHWRVETHGNNARGYKSKGRKTISHRHT